MTSVTGAWGAPPATLVLPPDEVHVWRARLDVPPTALAALAAVCSSEEHTRAARFRFARDRCRCLAARGLLRMILGWYLGRHPARLRLIAGAHGKPHLAGGAGVRSLRFNLAHADDLALVAVARGREVGVDVEREQPERADLAVARRMFAPREAEALAALPPLLRARAFFTLWTIREAYAKGTGLGLAGTEAGPVPASWTVRQLPIEAGYAAALAVERGAPTVRCWEWSADAAPAAA